MGLEFCLVYSIVSSATLCILPWSLFLLSWHLYLAQQRWSHTRQIISAETLDTFYEVTFTVSRDRINIWSYEIKYLLSLRARAKILYFISPCIICVTIGTSHSTETHQLELYKELWQKTASGSVDLAFCALQISIANCTSIEFAHQSHETRAGSAGPCDRHLQQGESSNMQRMMN